MVTDRGRVGGKDGADSGDGTVSGRGSGSTLQMYQMPLNRSF